jgi:diguanylate cyclase (GGDEF)-like protein
MNARWRKRAAYFAGLLFGLTAGELAGLLLPGTWLALPATRLVWAAVAAAAATAAVEHMLSSGFSSTRRLRALNDLARQVSRPTALQNILDAGVAHAVRFTGADAGCLRLMDAEGNLSLASSINAVATYTKKQRRVSGCDPFLAAAMNAPDPVLLPPQSLRSEWLKLVPDLPIQAAAVTPVIADGNVLGLIILVSADPKSFQPDDLPTLRAIGAQVGIAITNARTYEKLLRELQTDPLTGLGSRRHFEDHYRRELERAKRYLRPVSLAMINVEHMKEINDRWGCVLGDRLLTTLGQLLKEVRGGDLAARYGGDEFVILMPETSLEDAQTVALRLRSRVTQLNEKRLFPFPVQVSIGVHQIGTLDAELVANADGPAHRVKQRRAVPPLLSRPRFDTVPLQRTGTDN